MSAYTTFKKKTHDLEIQSMNAIQSMMDCCGSLHQKAHNVQVGKRSVSHNQPWCASLHILNQEQAGCRVIVFY